MYCSSCHCSPCCCITSTEAAPTDCIDPGITLLGSYGAVYDEHLCPKRLLPYRGEDAEGNPITDTDMPLQGGVLTQTPGGDVRWSSGPCTSPPPVVIRVATDAQAIEAANYIPTLIGKAADGCDRCLLGSPDTASGRWKLVWVAGQPGWTTIPDSDSDFSALCTQLVSNLVLDPGNVGGYLVQVLSTESMAVGVSVMVGGYELVVTEVVDDEFVRLEQVVAPAAPVPIPAETSMCTIGYRPCPTMEEPFADEVTGCFEGHVVGFEKPADVNSMKVPGVIWRDQLGHWTFIGAPVDPVTGIVSLNHFLTTPAAPVAAAANPAVFLPLPRFRFISPVTIFTQLTGGLPTNATTTVTLSATAGFVPGATAAMISIDAFGLVGTAAYHCYVKINGIVRNHLLIGPAAAGAAAYSSPFFIPLDASSNVAVEVLLAPIAAGTATQYSCNVYVDGYYAP